MTNYTATPASQNPVGFFTQAPALLSRAAVPNFVYWGIIAIGGAVLLSLGLYLAISCLRGNREENAPFAVPQHRNV